ncbi:hypothetical protein JYA59_22105 [Vibrio neptunius]|nr:hypothetical protein [Vibrio neptunius]
MFIEPCLNATDAATLPYQQQTLAMMVASNGTPYRVGGLNGTRPLNPS